MGTRTLAKLQKPSSRLLGSELSPQLPPPLGEALTPSGAWEVVSVT